MNEPSPLKMMVTTLSPPQAEHYAVSQSPQLLCDYFHHQPTHPGVAPASIMTAHPKLSE